VLMDIGSHVTILGPASEIELVEGSPERQVLRICVEATGMARRLCAPREAVVERVSQAEDSGVNVVLFSSIDEEAEPLLPPSPPSRAGPLPRASPWARLRAALAALLAWLAACLPAFLRPGRGAGGGGSHAVAAARRAGRAGRGWWRRPVVAHVRGGYTISPREHPSEGQTPECLVTCILKVGRWPWCQGAERLAPRVLALRHVALVHTGCALTQLLTRPALPPTPNPAAGRPRRRDWRAQLAAPRRRRLRLGRCLCGAHADGGDPGEGRDRTAALHGAALHDAERRRGKPRPRPPAAAAPPAGGCGGRARRGRRGRGGRGRGRGAARRRCGRGGARRVARARAAARRERHGRRPRRVAAAACPAHGAARQDGVPRAARVGPQGREAAVSAASAALERARRRADRGRAVAAAVHGLGRRREQRRGRGRGAAAGPRARQRARRPARCCARAHAVWQPRPRRRRRVGGVRRGRRRQRRARLAQRGPAVAVGRAAEPRGRVSGGRRRGCRRGAAGAPAFALPSAAPRASQPCSTRALASAAPPAASSPSSAVSPPPPPTPGGGPRGLVPGGPHRARRQARQAVAAVLGRAARARHRGALQGAQPRRAAPPARAPPPACIPGCALLSPPPPPGRTRLLRPPLSIPPPPRCAAPPTSQTA
jgi:hypothetical protein